MASPSSGAIGRTVTLSSFLAGEMGMVSVTTTSFTGEETLDILKMQLEKGLNTFYEWGIDSNTVAERSIITPACGVGAIDSDKAERILKLTSDLSILMSER